MAWDGWGKLLDGNGGKGWLWDWYGMFWDNMEWLVDGMVWDGMVWHG